MHNLTLHLTDVQFGQLKVESLLEGLSVDAYIKKKLFNTDPGIFTPKEAIRRAKEKFEVGDTFEVRDLYSDQEWEKLDRGERIAFGRNFYSFTSTIEREKNVRLVEETGSNGRRARYELLRKEQ